MPPENSGPPSHNFLPSITQYLTSHLEHVRKKLNYTSVASHSFAFYCRGNHQPEIEPHLATLKKRYTVCSKDKRTMTLTPEQYSWLGSESSSATFYGHSIVSSPVDDQILEANSTNITTVLRSTIEVTDWFLLGLALGLPYFDLERIKHDEHNVRDRQLKMVSLWLNTGTASWKDLVQALLDPLVNRPELAKKICEQHPLV